MSENLFGKNLRELCLRHGSIAAVCRQMGVNRQQFNRYLTGETKPSAHTLIRIEEFFGINADTLALPQRPKSPGHSARFSPFGGPLEPGLNHERYCGNYFTYFRSPNFVGGIIKGFASLRLERNVLTSKSLDVYYWRDAAPSTTTRKIFYRMSGHASVHGDFLYILDQKTGKNPSYTMTCLHQSHGEHVQLLSGLLMGITYHSDRRPFSTNIAYEAIDARRSLSDVLRECGVYDEQSNELPREVRRIVRNDISDHLQVLVTRGL